MSELAVIREDRDEPIDVSDLGEGIKQTGEEKVELTHALATEVLGYGEFIGERPLRDNHVANLGDCMRRGTFHWEWVMLVIARCGEHHHKTPAGKPIRINWQHTCWARLEMAEKMRTPVRIMRYRCETENDLRQLYASCDRGAVRTRGNVIQSYLAGHPDFAGMKSHCLKLIPSGFALWHWETEGQRKQHDGDAQSYLLLTEFNDVANKVGQFLNHYKPSEFRHLMRSPVVAAMFATFAKVPTIAPQFWEAVANGVGFGSAEDPRLKLRNFCMNNSVGHGMGSKANLNPVDVESYYKCCIAMWNAWRAGRSVKLVRTPDSRPVVA